MNDVKIKISEFKYFILQPGWVNLNQPIFFFLNHLFDFNFFFNIMWISVNIVYILAEVCRGNEATFDLQPCNSLGTVYMISIGLNVTPSI